MAENVEKIISVKFDAQQAIKGLADLNGQIDANQTKLKEMANAGEKGTKAFAQLEQETKSLRKQKQDLSQAVQNEVKQQNMLDGSLRKMRAELSNLTKQYDALSKAERENVNVGGKLKNQINTLTKELKSAEEGTQRYYRNVGNYKNAILETIGANTMFGSSLVNIVNIEGGFKGAMAAMGNSVKAFSASLAALLANPMFWAVAGVAGAGAGLYALLGGNGGAKASDGK
jgi:chromosome segregation ATPase